MNTTEHADPSRGPVVLLVADGALANIVVNAFASHFDDLVVIREAAETKAAILRRRRRILGSWAAFGQLLGGLAIRGVGIMSRRRIDRICAEHNLDRSFNRSVSSRSVGSVNSQACRQALRELSPAVVAVYGTRVITPDTLHCIAAPFINYHAGINPQYRGQHPAYWALVSRDADNAGITIHVVDEGVDTGGVIARSVVRFEASDTIATYQYRQAAAALPVFIAAIEAAASGAALEPITSSGPSRHWFPPTLWRYLWNGISRGVW